METAEVLEESPGRKTRSGRQIQAPKAKGTPRKTRKKMVLMEVEVSDEEETGVNENQKPEITHPKNDENGVELDANPTEPQSVMEIEDVTDGVNSEETEKMKEKVEGESVEDKEPVITMPIDDSNQEDVKNDVTDGRSGEEGVTFQEINDGDVSMDMEKSVSSDKIQPDPDTENISEDELPGVQIAKVPETEEVSDEELPGPKRSELSTDTEIQPDPDTENISEDELPSVQVAKVPETEEVSDEELPGPKRAELPADTEVVSEDELPAVKREGGAAKRKLPEGDYDPGSPTSENDTFTAKKPFLEADLEKEKEIKEKPKKLPELDKYWKAVNDDPTDFTGWTYLLQYVDQENDMEAAREAYDAFLSHYPYCYGYWRKYADYEKRKGNKKKCEEVFERGLKSIPLSVDLWIHYLTYVRTTRQSASDDDEEFTRSQFERALAACGLEFRSDRLWESYIKWETEGKRYQKATAIYDRLLATPTQGYIAHFDNFQEHVTNNPPNKIVEIDEFLALRKEVKHALKRDSTSETATTTTSPSATADGEKPDLPPGEDREEPTASSDDETKAIRERIISIRRKIHKNTSTAVTSRWNFEEGIKRPYFHVKPLERCQLKNWQEYLDFEIEQGDQTRIIVLFERCLIACALYEDFWLRFVHYLEGLKDTNLHPKIKDVYERACTIHHIKKPALHLQWAMFEESIKNFNKAAEILVNIEKSVPNLLQVAYRRINLERRRGDHEKCCQLYEHYVTNSKNKAISTNLAIKYARFALKILNNVDKAFEVIRTALTKDPNNARLYLQLIDLTISSNKDPKTCEKEVLELMDTFLAKDSVEIEQKVMFAQGKVEFLEDFGSDIESVQAALEDYRKYLKTSKEKKDSKDNKKGGSTTTGVGSSSGVGGTDKTNSANQMSGWNGGYGNLGNSSMGYQYGGGAGSQYNYANYQGGAAAGAAAGGGDQYQYGNWQYPQGGYGGYNQWSGYGSGYGY